MASCITILDSNAAVLIHRAYRGDVAQNVSEVFRQHVLDQEEVRITPVFEEQGYTYTFVRHNDVYILMVSNINTCSLMQIAFMRQTIHVFETYFKRVTEETVRDNFVIIYELLDEMCDFGFPQFTEAKVLQEYITQRGLIPFLMDEPMNTKALPNAVTGAGGATPWRSPNKYKYHRNEVFLDVVEGINLLMSQDGETLSSEVVGSIQMNVRLSGMPTVKVGLNDKVLFDLTGRVGRAVEMDDVRFHQCVKLNAFESERAISFIPPDGKFELMSYRLNKKINPLIGVRCTVIRHGTSRVEMICSGRANYRRAGTVASVVDVLVPIPADADKPQARCTHGAVKYAPESGVLIWGMRNVPGGSEFSCRVQFHLPSIRSSDVQALSKAPIQVKFEIPRFAASGFQVRYVKITEKSNYDAVPWVRYVTQSNDYQIRTN